MITVSVCVGSACHLKGSYNVISELQGLTETYNLGGKVDIKAIFCMGHCTEAVSVRIGDGEVESLDTKSVKAFFLERILPLGATAEV